MTGTALRVLIAEDEEHLGSILEVFLRARGHDVRRVRDGRSALEALGRERYDVALLDVMMPELDGLEVLRALPDGPAAPQAVVMTGNATVDVALSALQLGAYDYITKPYRMAEVDALVRRAAEKGALRREVALLRRRLTEVDPPEPFVTGHAPLLAVLEDATLRAAPAVLLAGEAGSGRRTLARRLHALGEHAAWPVLEVRCTGQPAVDEAAIFGPADDGAPGTLAAAAGGAALLREVDRLAPGTAARLDRALADGAFTDGCGARVTVGARLLLTAGPATAVAPDATRRIAVPALRERPVDIPLLARHFLRRTPGAAGAGPAVLGDGAAAWLARQPWPGNATELRLAVELAALRRPGAVLDEALLRAIAAPAGGVAPRTGGRDAANDDRGHA